MNTQDANINFTYMPIGMVEKDISQHFSNQDLLKELDEGNNYTKIVIM